MTITEHLDKQDQGRKLLLKTLHELILKHDPSVEPLVGSMMGKEMILYRVCLKKVITLIYREI